MYSFFHRLDPRCHVNQGPRYNLSQGRIMEWVLLFLQSHTHKHNDYHPQLMVISEIMLSSLSLDCPRIHFLTDEGRGLKRGRKDDCWYIRMLTHHKKEEDSNREIERIGGRPMTHKNNNHNHLGKDINLSFQWVIEGVVVVVATIIQWRLNRSKYLKLEVFHSFSLIDRFISSIFHVAN